MAELKNKAAAASSVFDMGSFTVTTSKVSTSNSTKPPKPLFIVTPTKEGSYPVIQFHHGFLCLNCTYSQILQHISSYGYIVVAPQCYVGCRTSQPEEIDSAAAVTNWLSTGLTSLLPENVKPNLNKLAISGHSRGGKTAFCLALGYGNPSLKFSSLIGIDPVAGNPITGKTEPEILTCVPSSLNIDIPVCIIGTGLGSEKTYGIIACAPEGMNSAEFFKESKPPCSYLVATDYGHTDMLDSVMAIAGSCVCKSGKGCKQLMRKAVAGIFVAFLKASIGCDDEDFLAIVDDPSIAPIQLDPVEYIKG